MRVTSVALAAHLVGSAHTIATCWRVQRVDGQVFGFTSFDRDLEIDGVLYSAALGLSPTSVESREGLAVANANATGILDSESITDEDLRAGVWDHAEVRVFDVNWADLTQGHLKQLRGWFGEFTLQGGIYSTELRGLASALNASIGELVGPGCTATVGDARCKVDLTDYTTTGTVTAVNDNRSFDTDLAFSTVRLTPTETGTPTTGYFDAGLLTWLTGLNAGRLMEVKMYADDGALELQLPMAGDVAGGDTFSVSSGCAKSRDVCREKFNNVLNFRGFPDLPGIDRVMRFAGQ